MLPIRVSVALAAAMFVAACGHGSTAPNFTLTAQNGTSWSLAAQRGKTVALFFGYTHCSDVCPTTLATLSKAMSSLGPKSNGAEIVFVTIDPERDTPPVLARWISLFDNPHIVGLTGTRAQLKPVYAAYHVWAQRIPGRKGSGYEMAHSSTVYMIGPDGSLRGVHDWQDSEQSFARAFKDTAG
jgi:protein SCO1